MNGFYIYYILDHTIEKEKFMYLNDCKESNLEDKVLSYLRDCCLDIHGISGSSVSSMMEAQLTKILTKIIVAIASIWWSSLELRDFFKTRSMKAGY